MHVGGDVVETWYEVIEVSGPLVTFRGRWVFASDGVTLTSDSTLRFRDRREVSRGAAAERILNPGHPRRT